MFRLFAKPDIDFMGIRNIMFVGTLLLSILGITLFIGRLPNDLNIDFVGGTAYGGKAHPGLTIQELRGLVDEPNQKKWLGGAQAKEEEGSHGYTYTIAYKNPDGTTDSRSINIANPPVPDPSQDPKASSAEAARYQEQLKQVVKQREEIITRRAQELPESVRRTNFLSADFKTTDKMRSTT